MLTPARIAVLVSGGGTNLEALLRAQESGALPHGQIVLVLSSAEGAYALVRARNHGVPGFAVPRRGVKITGATVHLVNEVPDGGRILAAAAESTPS
jgi:phosphoribosylglycinamide formyltransferase-1